MSTVEFPPGSSQHGRTKDGKMPREIALWLCALLNLSLWLLICTYPGRMPAKCFRLSRIGTVALFLCANLNAGTFHHSRSATSRSYHSQYGYHRSIHSRGRAGDTAPVAPSTRLDASSEALKLAGIPRGHSLFGHRRHVLLVPGCVTDIVWTVAVARVALPVKITGSIRRGSHSDESISGD